MINVMTGSKMKELDISYWEDSSGVVNEVSMDLEQLLVIIDQGIAGNPTFFRELKVDVIEHVRRYQIGELDEDNS